MRRSRKIEILKLLKDYIYVDMHERGLCHLLDSLHHKKLITERERFRFKVWILKVLKKEVPIWHNHFWTWKRGLIEPRINWINKTIKRLEKQNNKWYSRIFS